MRTAYHKADLRDRVKRMAVIWRKEHRLWEITYRDSKRLGIADGIVETKREGPSTHRYAPAYGAIHK